VADKLSRARRSENMRRIRSVGMRPELAIRSLVHRMGYRYRIHAPALPAKPDLVFRSLGAVILVHGCFWHQHSRKNCLDGRLPKTNKTYWVPKLQRNVERDRRNLRKLRRAGWRVLVIWECQTNDVPLLEARLKAFLGPRSDKDRTFHAQG
jgi:DNA mismatch endonuclease (patch repair protein)